MKLLILGAGGIGGYFGGRLVESGADVTFLVREKRRDQLARDGLRIESELGNARLQVKTVLSGELEPGYDIVLLTCKAYDLDAAMDAIAPAMDGKCAIVPMLNGMAHLERLDARFGRSQVLGGTCMIDVRLQPDGVILHGGKLQRLVFGERDRSRSDRALAFAAMLDKSILEGVLSPDIVQAMWDKLVFLSALAATTCLFRANVREIMSAPGGREAVERTLAVNIDIATREGHTPTASTMKWAHDRLTDPNGNWSASLLRDLEAGGLIEGDHIVGWMLERARKHGLDDTMLSLAYTALKAYEFRRDHREG